MDVLRVIYKPRIWINIPCDFVNDPDPRWGTIGHDCRSPEDLYDIASKCDIVRRVLRSGKMQVLDRFEGKRYTFRMAQNDFAMWAKERDLWGWKTQRYEFDT